MKKARTVAGERKKHKPRGFRYAGIEPLRRPRHEIFAHAYVSCFDGAKSAALAGYGDRAARAWPRLMRCRRMQVRVAALANNIRVPGSDAAAVLKALIADTFVDISSIIRRNARPGEEIFDLSRASGRQLRALDIRQEVITTGGRKTTKVSIRPKDLMANYRLVAAELGIGASAADGPPPTDLEEAFQQILARGSKATIYVAP